MPLTTGIVSSILVDSALENLKSRRFKKIGRGNKTLRCLWKHLWIVKQINLDMDGM